MDRRRFVPSPEGLEGRALLSLFGGSSATTNTTQTEQSLPETFKAKLERIEHLPYYLQQIDPDTPLPADATRNLQSDLADIAGRLHAPNGQYTENFNLGLRDAYPHSSLSAQDAASLNRAFGVVLESAGATPVQADRLKRDMNDLARAASHSSQPVILASNEYAIVLQIALTVGRPIQTPTAPRLQAKQGIEANGGAVTRTPLHNPTFIGTYLVGATANESTHVQIVDSTGSVLATGAVLKTTGNYTAKVETPLHDGTYRVQARAVDAQGHQSNLSPVFTLKVYTGLSRRTLGG